MSEEDIIDEFVNSSNFEIIDNYISKPYIETIEELDKEIERLKEKLQTTNSDLSDKCKRIIKALEYIDNCIGIEAKQELRNILQGSDK